MVIQGELLDRRSRTIKVAITINDGTQDVIDIGAEGSPLDFTDDPVVIESGFDDSFDVVIAHSAKVNLYAHQLVPQLFTKNQADAEVLILRDGAILFDGYIEPQTYDQSFAEAWDELQINCVDRLAAMENRKWRNVGLKGVDFGTLTANAEQLSFFDVLKSCLDVQSNSTPIFYDGSIAADDNPDNRYKIFEQLTINEVLFLGDDEDSTWDCGKVVEAILRYLDLHIVMWHGVYWIFSWATLRNDGGMAWQPLDGSDSLTTAPHEQATISVDNVADDECKVSFGEVFNRVRVKCETKAAGAIIESPLDNLHSNFAGRQLYMRDYTMPSPKNPLNSKAKDFIAMCKDAKPTSTDTPGTICDYYLNVKYSESWQLRNGGEPVDAMLGPTHQEALPNALNDDDDLSHSNHGYYYVGAGAMAFGKVERKYNVKDNNPQAKIEMTDYLVVGVNGNGQDGDQYPRAFPNETSLLRYAPIATYIGKTMGGAFTPPDEKSVNYIVISGKLYLQPRQSDSANYTAVMENSDGSVITALLTNIIKSKQNPDGKLYTRQWFKANTPLDTPEWDRLGDGKVKPDHGPYSHLTPLTGDDVTQYQFNYSGAGDSNDHISKVAVLACMLVIGDKVLIEDMNKDGDPSAFSWQPFKTLEQCGGDRAEYLSQCFTIGFNPKIGDYLIGQEYSIQNNIDYTMGLDVEGMAIPIHNSDAVTGAVHFEILGPVNSVWSDITRRHPTWFRHTKWSSGDVSVLSHVAAIFASEFKMELHSNNGLIDTVKNSDLVYCSDVASGFVNEHEETFTISSALTLDEQGEMGFADVYRLNTPVSTLTNAGVLSVYDYSRKLSAKPERLYVDSYYNEFSQPRIILRQNFNLADEFNPFALWKHPALPDKEFYCQSFEYDLIQCVTEAQFKEI